MTENLLILLQKVIADAELTFGVKVSFCVEVSRLPNLDRRGPTAVDIVVHHPLQLSAPRNGLTERQSLKQAEEFKIRDSENLCHGNGWLFAPMGWHTWGGVGPYGSAMLTRLEGVIAGDLQGWPKIHLVNAFRRKLTFALMGFVAKQLRAAEDAMIAEPRGDIPPPFTPGPVFTVTELVEWEKDEEEAVFVGPIRVRGVRPCRQSAQ